MRLTVRHMIPFIFAALCILCLTHGFLYACTDGEREEITLLQLDTPYDGTAAKTYSVNAQNSDDEAYPPFAFWAEQKRTAIQNPDLGRSTRSLLITVYGDSSLVLSGSQILDRDSLGYCLIDTRTSQALFGSAHATGQRIEIDRQIYEVAGTVNSAAPTVLVQYDSKSSPSLDKLSLRMAGSESRKERLRVFLNRTGMEGTEIPLHYYRIWGVVLVFILPVLLLSSVLYDLAKIMHTRRDMPVLWLLLLLLFLGYAIISVWVLDIHGQFPPELLPTKWSDFNFWSNLWQQTLREAEFLMRIEKSQPHLILFYRFLTSAGYSLLALLSARFSCKKMTQLTGMAFYISLLCYPVISFFAISVFSTANSAAAENRVLWLLFPAYAAGKYGIMWLHKQLL